MNVTYTIECLEEDTGPQGSFATGDDQVDQEIVDKIIADYEGGNPWAWCVVKVTAIAEMTDSEGFTHRFTGEDYLGGCSYKSEDDFKNDGYYEDMKKEAKDRLIETLEGDVRRGILAGCVLNEITLNEVRPNAND